jgi:hypothetical protein
VSRHQTPIGGLVAISCAGLLVLAGAGLFTSHFDMIELTVVAWTIAVLAVYLVVAAGAFRLIGRGVAAIPRAIVVVAGAAVPVLGIYGSLHPWPTGIRRDGLLLAAGIAVVIATWFAGVLRYRRTAIDTAGDHALVNPSDGALLTPAAAEAD